MSNLFSVCQDLFPHAVYYTANGTCDTGVIIAVDESRTSPYLIQWDSDPEGSVDWYSAVQLTLIDCTTSFGVVVSV